MAQKQPAPKSKSKAQPAPGRAVTIGTPQTMLVLHERLAELQTQKHFIEMAEAICATLMVNGIDYLNPIDKRTGKPIWPKPMITKNGVALLRLYLDLQFAPPNVEDLCDFSIREQPLVKYRVRTDIYDKQGRLLGCGLGVCSSMELKYRYRWLTAQQLPASMKVGMLKLFKKTDKNTGEVKEVEGIDQQAWIDTYGAGSARFTQYGIQVRVDSPDIYDQENTILGQAKKRSESNGTLLTTGAGRVFLLGEEEIRAAASIKIVEPNGTEEQVESEIVQEEPEQPPTKIEMDIKAFQEELKSWMVKAGFTIEGSKLDLMRFKKLLLDTYKVENVGQLDEKGRAKLLSQMADFASAAEEAAQNPA